MAGSYYVEYLTDQIEKEAMSIISKIDVMGGSVAAIESGFMQNEIAASAYRYQQNIEQNKNAENMSLLCNHS